VNSTRAILLEEPKKAERLRILMLSLDNPTLSKDERAEVRETADSVRKQLLVEAKAHDSQEIPGVLKVRCRGITEYSTSSAECKRKLVASLGVIHISRIKLEPPSTYVLPNGPRGLGLSNGEQIRVFCANLAKGETIALALARARTASRPVTIRSDADVYSVTREDAKNLSRSYIADYMMRGSKKANGGAKSKAGNARVRK